MRFLLAILLCSFIIFIEMLTFPLLEQWTGKEISHGLAGIVLPLMFGFLGWVIGDLLIRQKRRSQSKYPKMLSPRAQLCLAAVVVWEGLILSYILMTKSLITTPVMHWSTLTLLIMLPPLIMVCIYLLVLMMIKSLYFKRERFKEAMTYFKENLNTFPVFLQILSALALLTTIFRLPLNYHNFLSIFIFVSAVISAWDAYRTEEFNFTTLFIIIACLYNPTYPIYLDKQIWLILNMMVAFFFVYKVSSMWITEQNLEKNLKVVARKIDLALREFDKNTSDYTLEMIGKYIKNKHSYALSIKGESMEWKEKTLPHFTFSMIEVFNGESAICVSGKDAFEGFHTLLIFYNKTFKYMIFLDLNATITAKRLKKIMTQNFGYFEYNRHLPQRQ